MRLGGTGRCPEPPANAIAHDRIADLLGHRKPETRRPRGILAAAQQALEHKTLPDGAHTAPHCQEFRTPAQPLHAEQARRRKPQADSRLRPRARRAESTLRPPVVAIRVRKPWRRLRTSLLG